MKVIRIRKGGEVNLHTFEEREEEKPEISHPKQCLIKIEYAGMNPVDFKTCENWFGDSTGKILSQEMSGTIEEIGEEVTKFQVGDKVFGHFGTATFSHTNMALAEYTCIHENILAKVPENIPMEIAGGCALAGITAYECVIVKSKAHIMNTAEIRASHFHRRYGSNSEVMKKAKKGAGHLSVLVTGASGGVGTFIVRMLQYLLKICEETYDLPKSKIYVTAGGIESINYAKETLGIPESQILNYRDSVEDIIDGLINLNDGTKIDFSYDLVGSNMKSLCLKCLTFDGLFTTIVEEMNNVNDFKSGAIAFWDPMQPGCGFHGNLTVNLVWVGMREVLGTEEDSYDWYERMQGFQFLLENKHILPPATLVQPFTCDSIFQNLSLLKSARNRQGKIVIKID